MSVGLLIISHGRVGEALLDTAISVLGICPLQVEVMSIGQDCEPDAQIAEAHRRVDSLDLGEGVLVLTDMYGSTPGNIAGQLVGERIAVVAGVNLPMLVRLLNYPQMGLEELVTKAVTGGRDGVMPYSPKGN